MDISSKNVHNVRQRKRDKTPSHRRRARTTQNGVRKRRSDRTLVQEEPYSAILPTIITPKDIETTDHPTRLGHSCRYCQQREADVWFPRMGGLNTDDKYLPMRIVRAMGSNEYREDARPNPSPRNSVDLVNTVVL